VLSILPSVAVPLILFALTIGTAVWAWRLFTDTGHLPRNPLATYYRFDGVGVLVDRPDIEAKFGLSCSTEEPGYETRFCTVGLRFGRDTPPGTRWAIALSAKLEPLGRGKVLRGIDHKITAAGSWTYSNGPWPVFTPVPDSYGVPENISPYPIAADGRVIVGTVTKDGPRTDWRPPGGYWGELESLGFQPQISLDIRVPQRLAASANGVTVGSVPHIGIYPGPHYRLIGKRHEVSWPLTTDWQPPDTRYYAAASAPVVTYPLLGNLETKPESTDGRSLRWETNEPFQAIWSYTQPSVQSETRRNLFISGALISLAGSFFVAFVQVLLGRRRRA
jgi:hypothetical protein